MKKYFLLATTALLLGTSHVMAGVYGEGDFEQGSGGTGVTTEVKIRATVYKTSNLAANDFGFDRLVVSAADLAAGQRTHLLTVGNNTIEYTDAVVNTPTETSSVGMVEIVGDLGTPIFVDGIDSVEIASGLTFENMSFIPVDEITWCIGGDLYLDNDKFKASTGKISGEKSFTIGITYD